MSQIFNLKINKLEMKKFISVAIDQFLNSLSSILIMLLLTNTYSKNEYASFVLLSSITLTILGFQRAIITQPFAINLNDYFGFKKYNYFNYNVYLKLIFNAVIIVIFPLFFLSNEFNENLNFVICALFYILVYTSYFFIKDMFLSSRNTTKTLFYSSFVTAFIIFLAVITHNFKFFNFTQFIFLLSLIYLFAFIFFIIFKKRRVSYKFSFKNDFWYNNLKVGKWIVGSNLLYSISSQSSPWIILYLLTKEDVAIYGVLVGITGLVNPIIKSLNAYLLPVLSKASQSVSLLKEKMYLWFFFFLIVASIFLILGFLFGEILIPLIFSEKYSNLGFIVFLPFINQSINILFQPIDLVMNVIKRTDLGFYILLIRTFCSLILAYLLISKFGLMGVFIAKIIENLIYQSLLSFYTLNHIKKI